MPTLAELQQTIRGGSSTSTVDVQGPIQRLIASKSLNALSSQDISAIQEAVANDPKYAGHPLKELFKGAPYSEATTKELQDLSTRSQMTPEQLRVYDTLPPEEQQAFRTAQLSTGQTVDQQQEARQKAQAMIDLLASEGLDANDAVKLQQTVLGMRGEELSEITNTFAGYAQGVQQGLIKAEDLRSIGAQLGSEIDELMAEGRDITTEFAPRLRALNQQIESEIPGIREYSQKMDTLGDNIGTFDDEDFNRRFQPALTRLQRQFDINRQSIIDSMAERGIAPGSENERFQNLVLTRDQDEDLKNAMLQAQAGSQAQRLSEYGAKTTSGLSTRLSPLDSLRKAMESTTGEADSRLRIYAAKGNTVNQRANQYQLGQGELGLGVDAGKVGVDASNETYNARTAEINQANQRFGDTFGQAIAQSGVPQSERLAIGANTTTSSLGARLGYGAKQHETNTARTVASRQMPFNILGAGMGAVGSMGAAAILASSRKVKDNIEELPEDTGEKALDALNSFQIKRWNYKGDPLAHLGGIAEEMPDEVTTPEKNAVNLNDEMALLTEAVKALDKRTRTRKYGSGLNSLKEVGNA